MNVQVIEHNGMPEYAVLPFLEYQKMCEALETAEDLSDARAFKARLAAGDEESYPADMVERILLEGSNPLMEFRKLRGLTQTALAEKVGVQQAAIAQFEKGRRDPSVKVLKKLAAVLAVDMDSLVD